MKISSAFLLSVLCAFTFASISHTQFVLNNLVAIGVDISLGTRLATTWGDLIGLAPGYGSVVLIGSLLGFTIIGLLRRFFKWSPLFAYSIGGALSFAAMQILMYPLLHITLIAGARGSLGFSFQCLAGIIGGLVFARLLGWAEQKQNV